MSDPSADRDTLAGIISEVNNAWLEGNTEVLRGHFHEHMVIAGPNAVHMGEGKEACVKSYSDFIDNAHIANFTSEEPDINIWGNTALVVYEFEIIYKMHGKEYHETGKDVFTFARESNSLAWQAVCRMVLPVEAHTDSV